MKNKLILVRGLPGSGKSTLAAKIAKHDNTLWFEADQYFMEDGTYMFRPQELGDAHEWCQERTRAALDKGFDVVVSNTFTTHREMEPYFQICEALGLSEPTIFVCSGSYKSVHNVPEETMQRMRSRWED